MSDQTIEAQPQCLATHGDIECLRAELRIDLICVTFVVTVVNIATVSAGIAFLRLTGTA